MLNKILPFTKKLIAIKSNPDNQPALAEALSLVTDRLKKYTIEKFERNGAKSILVYNTGKRPRKFTVILNGHLDVIPGKVGQYQAKVKGDRLYGVGSMDMKANVVSMITAFEAVADKVNYPLALQLVTDEEVGGFDGTKYQIEKGVRADFVIAGESTDFNIKNQAKGIIWLKVLATGQTAHGAHPWRGDNAISKMSEFVEKLRKNYPVPQKESWVSTVNVANIKTTNEAFNKVPDVCELWLDVRYIPEEGKKIINNLKRLMPKGLTMEIIANEPALNTLATDSYLQILKTVTEKVTKKKVKILSANGSSDARHFALVGCPGIEFGPIGGDIASDREWVDMPSLETFTVILEKFLLGL